MTDAFLTEVKRVLDTLAGDAQLSDASDDGPVMQAAVRTFKGYGPELLDEATPYLWEYYRSVAEAFSVDERSGFGIPELDAAHNIWREVSFRFPPTVRRGARPLEPAQCYISFEADVSWELEHGLQLVFEDGTRVCKVGPYDDHNTVAHAYGDASLLDVVFR